MLVSCALLCSIMLLSYVLLCSIMLLSYVLLCSIMLLSCALLCSIMLLSYVLLCSIMLLSYVLLCSIMLLSYVLLCSIMLLSYVLLWSIMLLSYVLLCCRRRYAFPRFSSEQEVIMNDYWLTNCKWCGRKQSWFNFGYYPGIFPQVQKENHDESKHYSLCFRAGNLNRDLCINKQKC
jgi:hypothetical protein